MPTRYDSNDCGGGLECIVPTVFTTVAKDGKYMTGNSGAKHRYVPDSRGQRSERIQSVLQVEDANRSGPGLTSGACIIPHPCANRYTVQRGAVRGWGGPDVRSSHRQFI